MIYVSLNELKYINAYSEKLKKRKEKGHPVHKAPANIYVCKKVQW